MSNIRQRAIKAAQLTQAEVDANDKIQVSGHVASYTLTKSDNQDTQEFNGASLVATLPSVATITNTSTGSETGEFTTTIKNIHSTALTITPNGLDKIDGVNSSTTLSPNQSITLQTNNATDGWNILSKTNLLNSTKLTAPASSISIGSLSFAADKAIEVTALITTVTASPNVYLMINGDTISTNYYSSHFTDNGAPVAGNNPGIYAVVLGQRMSLNMTIVPDATNNQTHIITQITYFTSTNTNSVIHNAVYTASGTVASIGLREGTGANYLGIGTMLSVKAK